MVYERELERVGGWMTTNNRLCGLVWCNAGVDEKEDGNTVIDPGMCPAHWTDFLLSAHWIREHGGKHLQASRWITYQNELIRQNIPVICNCGQGQGFAHQHAPAS